MADSYNDDDLLLFDVIALIKAYEEGMFKEIKTTEPSEEIILTGYQHPLTGMQATIELSLLAAENSMEDIVNGIVTEQKRYASTVSMNETNSTDSEEENLAIDPEEDIDYAYAECSFTDAKGEPSEEWWDPQDAVVRKNLNFFPDKNDPNAGEPIGYEYRKRFTNDYKTKFGAKITKYLDDKVPTVSIGDKEYKLSIEECLNCMVDINIELTMPSLEFIFNLDKLLQQIEKLLKDMLKAMDPSLLYDAICAFLLNFGANFACPANLIGINLVLPTLFAKYSLDLAKIRFDWTSLFGAMIKGLLEFLVQAVESVPKMINPFIDCIINALKTVMNAIRSIVASGEKITNEAISAVNEVGYAVQKITPDSWFDPVSLDIKQEYDALLKDMKEKLVEEREEIPEELEEFAEWLKNASIKSGLDETPFTLENTKKLLEEYLKDPDNSDLKHYLEYNYDVAKAKSDAKEKRLQPQYEKRIKAAKDKEELESKKDFFNFDLVADTKTITTPYFKKEDKPDKRLNFDYDPNGSIPILRGGVTTRDSSIKKSDWSALDYAFAKFGVDIKNEYRQPKDLVDYRAKGWVRKLNESEPFQFIEKTVIGYLLLAKKWLNEQVSKIVQTLKALQAFMGDVVESEFRILGDLSFIAHLIRFIRLIMKFYNEGLSCENIRKNKTTVEKIISANNNNIDIEQSVKSVLLGGKKLNPEDYIKVKHRITKNTTIIDLNECSNLSSMLKVKKDNIDVIYEGILNGLQT